MRNRRISAERTSTAFGQNGLADDDYRDSNPTVQKWLQDRIMDDAPASTPAKNLHDFRRDPYERSVESKTIRNLSRRVQDLEASIDAAYPHSTVHPLHRNHHPMGYDHYYDAPPARKPVGNVEQPDPTVERKIDQLLDMFNKVTSLEDRFQNDEMENSQQTRHEPQLQEKSNPEHAKRLERLEDKLGDIESHLTKVLDRIADQTMPNIASKPQAVGQSGESPRRSRRARRSQQSLQNAVGQAVQYGNDASPAENERTQATSYAQSNSTELKQLMGKIEALKAEGGNDVKVREILGELEELRAKILDDSNNHLLGSIQDLQNSIGIAAKSNASGLEPNAIQALERDVNRIAEFLLMSPDLKQVPDQVDAIASRIGQISDGLLAAMDKTESLTKANSAHVVHKIENSLGELKAEILAQARETINAVETRAAENPALEGKVRELHEQFLSGNEYVARRLTGFEEQFKAVSNKIDTLRSEPTQQISLPTDHSALEQQISTALENFSGQMHSMQDRVLSATEKLEMLGHERNQQVSLPEPSAEFKKIEERLLSATDRLENLNVSGNGTQDFQEMEKRLLSAAERLEIASVEAAKTQGEMPRALLQIPKNIVTGEILQNGLNQAVRIVADQQAGLIERVDQAISALDQISSQNPANIEELLKKATDDTVRRLEQTQTPGAAPVELPDFEFLKTHLANLEDASGAIRKEAQMFSSETRDAFNSVNSILERVSERLSHLEQGQQELPSRFRSTNMDAAPQAQQHVEEPKPQALPKADEPVFELNPTMRSKPENKEDVKDDPISFGVEPQRESSPSHNSELSSDEESLIERMRKHVKSRDPDAPLLPADDDVPLEPGTGKPRFDPFADAPEPASMVDQSPESVGEEEDARDGLNSKADFVAAARRAAQVAAADAASAELATDTDESKKRASSIWSRIRRKKDEKTEVEFDENAEDTSFENEIEVFEVENTDDEDNEKSPRRWLSVVLAVAIVGILAYMQKHAIVSLVASFTGPSSTAIVEQSVEPTIPAKLSTPGTVTVNKTPKTEGVTEQPLPGATPYDSGTNSENSVEPTDLYSASQDQAAALDANGIDTTPIESISAAPDLSLPDNNDNSGQSIFAALSKLPEGIATEKLSTALLEEDPNAFFELARRFSEGKPQDRNLESAAFWYEKAANAGLPIAQYRLGTLYQDGIGVDRDLQTAKFWYQTAADAGNARAMHNLAVLDAEGALGKPDFNTAFKWFKKAADLGITDSQYNLAILYVRGLGTKPDLIEAFKWFDITAKKGDKDAEAKRGEIAKALGSEKLALAQTAARSWQKTPWKKEANQLTRSASFWNDEAPNRQSTAQKRSGNLIKEAQTLLNSLGYEAGTPDGVYGANTEKAVRAFQFELGIPSTGKIDENLLNLLEAQRT